MVDSLLAKIEQDETVIYDVLEREHTRLWLALYHGRTTNNKIMQFDNRLWMIDPYMDDSDTIVIQKASQIGVSDWAIAETFSKAKQGLAVMYVLPSDKLVYDFTPRRIDKLIGWVPYYRENCVDGYKASDTKKQKTLFGKDCFFVGSNSITNFYEKPVDVLVIDEHDKCDMANLIYAFDRLEASKHNFCRVLGNPEIESVGINERFSNTDCKEWFLKCPHCGEWQELDWFVNVVKQDDNGNFSLIDASITPSSHDGDASPCCRRCFKPIDRLAQGQWVAKYPDRQASGYHCSTIFGNPKPGTINRLFSQFTTGLSVPTALQNFYNNRLGLPFTAKGSVIDEDMLNRCSDASYALPMTSSETVAGVDVGGRLHVNISKIKDGKRVKVFVGSLPLDGDELDRVCRLYGVRIGVMDALPDQSFVNGFVNSHPGWYRCFYPTGVDKELNLKVDHTKRIVTIGRTESLDMSFAEYLDGKVVLPKDWRFLDNGDFVKHLKASVRLYEEPTGSQFVGRFVWKEGNKPDHHRHSDNYEMLAKMIYQGGENMLTVV